jgi:hypothetical protein
MDESDYKCVLVAESSCKCGDNTVWDQDSQKCLGPSVGTWECNNNLFGEDCDQNGLSAFGDVFYGLESIRGKARKVNSMLGKVVDTATISQIVEVLLAEFVSTLTFELSAELTDNLKLDLLTTGLSSVNRDKLENEFKGSIEVDISSIVQNVVSVIPSEFMASVVAPTILKFAAADKLIVITDAFQDAVDIFESTLMDALAELAATETADSCYLAYCNADTDLSEAFCSGGTCSDETHVLYCKEHFEHFKLHQGLNTNTKDCVEAATYSSATNTSVPTFENGYWDLSRERPICDEGFQMSQLSLPSADGCGIEGEWSGYLGDLISLVGIFDAEVQKQCNYHDECWTNVANGMGFHACDLWIDNELKKKFPLLYTDFLSVILRVGLRSNHARARFWTSPVCALDVANTPGWPGEWMDTTIPYCEHSAACASKGNSVGNPEVHCARCRGGSALPMAYAYL